jgi:hypothetical protein
MASGVVHGHLDNFAGVHAVMQAYFSGRIKKTHVRIELTYGEEEGCYGAYELVESLAPEDVVIVVDVTGTPTNEDIVIEKCRDPELRRFMEYALDELSFDLYEGCPDPISNLDEVDVYDEKGLRSCMLAVPCWGGDYNEGKVYCRQQSLDTLAEAVCRLAEHFPKFFPRRRSSRRPAR